MKLTLCLDSKFGWKRKGGKGKEGKGKEGKRNGRKLVLVCLGDNGRERKGDCVFLPNLSTFEGITTLTKFYPHFPSNSLPSKSLPFYFAIQTRDSSSLQIPSFHFPPFPSKHTLSLLWRKKSRALVSFLIFNFTIKQCVYKSYFHENIYQCKLVNDNFNLVDYKSKDTTKKGEIFIYCCIVV